MDGNGWPVSAPHTDLKFPRNMNHPDDKRNSSLTTAKIALALFGLLSPFLTFALAISSTPEGVKIFVLVVLAVGYAVICFWALGRSRTDNDAGAAAESKLREDIAAIGNSAEFFGSSLKPEDLFRLISSRIGHVFPFIRSALVTATESGEALRVVQATGPGADKLVGAELPTDRGLAGMAWVSGEVEVDADLSLDSSAMPVAGTDGVSSAAAVPLAHEGGTFAVLVLYTERRISPTDVAMLSLVGERIGPLFIRSLSFERSVSSAVTDPITGLPNERAFYIVLENQLAESHRSRDDRPLTVLSVDIKGFAEVNEHAGFEVGDRMLAFTAENLAGQLRKMDFLTRATGDEFLIILPTASDEFTGEIIERIRLRFASTPFKLNETEEVKVWLNFGTATFWQDGETGQQLLQTSRLRKQQAKAEESGKMVWFPKEYVH